MNKKKKKKKPDIFNHNKRTFALHNKTLSYTYQLYISDSYGIDELVNPMSSLPNVH